MKINVSGGMDVGQSFPSYVEEKFGGEVSKCFDNVPNAEVRVKKQGPMVFTSIVVNDVFKKGNKINADAEGADAYKSFDEAFKKLVTQLRKGKGKSMTEKKKGIKA